MFRDNIRNGRGVQVYPNGDRYKGLFVSDVRHGFGVQTYANQDVYRGLWFNDERVNDEWEGIKYYNARPAQQPTVLRGEVPTFVPSAQRTLRDCYTGRFKGLDRHGHGTCVYADGSSYVGNWVADKYEGTGTLTYS